MFRALAFLTPFGRAATPTPRTLLAMPAVGAMIGLAVGGLWWLTGNHTSALVAAAVAVAADALLTGLLHLDGLSDSADGLLAPMDRLRRLAVMRDPAVGAFGAVALIVVLLLRFAVFASIVGTGAWTILTIGALWCLSRTVMAVVTRAVPYARSGGGLASAFRNDAHGGGQNGRQAQLGAFAPLVIGLAFAVPLAFVGSGARGLIALGIAVLVGGLVIALAWRRLGGFTGDVLGAAGVMAETAGLLVLAVQ